MDANHDEAMAAWDEAYGVRPSPAQRARAFPQAEPKPERVTIAERLCWVVAGLLGLYAVGMALALAVGA